MLIHFVDTKSDNANNLVVSSKKREGCHIFIETFVSILLASVDIKNLLKYKQNKQNKDVTFDISQLKKEYVKAFIYRIVQGIYTFDKYISKKRQRGVYFYAPQISAKIKKSICNIIANAGMTRDIINEPSNKSTPEIFANNVAAMFKDIKNVNVNIFSSEDIKKNKMGLVDAIGNSSNNSARFLVVDYNPVNSNVGKKTICLVGKGVTMDAGGYSLKNNKSMYKMHMDKTGAGICIGLMKMVCDNNYKNRVVAFCPLVENIVSDKSIKPGDIVTAYNGQTVEIVNVDAEGRLILADALSYACDIYKPDYIFDYATLTGWSSRIHCHTSFTFFTLDKKMVKNIIDVGSEYAERSIRMPPWTDYLSFIKSSVADVKNSNFYCEHSDGFMASIFLMNFIPMKYRNKWVHFDIRLDSYNNTANIADGFGSFYELMQRV
jgi:leucyl aminopeptidase